MGERAAATYEALHTVGHAQVEELSQRRWWALKGYLPAPEVSSVDLEDGHVRFQEAQDLIDHLNLVAEEDQRQSFGMEHMRPPNVRANWHALLEEVSREKDWRLNPCILEHPSAAAIVSTIDGGCRDMHKDGGYAGNCKLFALVARDLEAHFTFGTRKRRLFSIQSS
eukprot:symbB.v1.2.011290.t1/scaffold754.1/size165080/4